MTTKILDCMTPPNQHCLRVEGDLVVLSVQHGFQFNSANLTRADFLAAVEAECDVIIVRRAGLPSIDLTSDGKPYAGGQTSQSAEQSRDVARAHLALAEHLDTHPPMDEVQVEAAYDVIQDALREAGVTMGQVDHGVRMAVARTLIADGWAKS